MHSRLTHRRLRDGERAMTASENLDQLDRESLRTLRFDLENAVLAMQSLDDLGSEDANNKAWNDMLELQKRLDTVKRMLL